MAPLLFCVAAEDSFPLEGGGHGNFSPHREMTKIPSKDDEEISLLGIFIFPLKAGLGISYPMFPWLE